MLRSMKDLEGYIVSATDGDIGRVEDLLFDDRHWATRYLSVNTSSYSDNLEVLVSPISFRTIDWQTHRFNVAMTMEKVKNSPGIDIHKPVSRQHEENYYRYYGYPFYWGYSGVWGMEAIPSLLSSKKPDEVTGAKVETEQFDVHLRSAKEVRDYHIEGSDVAIGHVEDFIVDDESWEIRYMVINTSNWWIGKKVLVSPHWANKISWEERKVFMALSRESIKNSPEWDPSAGVNREYESRLYDYHGRPVYWGSGHRPD